MRLTPHIAYKLLKLWHLWHCLRSHVGICHRFSIAASGGGGDGESETRPGGAIGDRLKLAKPGENRRRDGGMRVPAGAWGPHVMATAGFKTER